MTCERFEDLPGWQAATELYEHTEELLENGAFQITRGFRDRLDRAALSVSNNIAEGFERGITNELLAFLYIARGSAGEVRSMLVLEERHASRAAGPAGLKSQIADLKSLAESCSRQHHARTESLQNSDIKGHRHLNDRVRRETADRRPPRRLGRSCSASSPRGIPNGWRRRSRV